MYGQQQPINMVIAELIDEWSKQYQEQRGFIIDILTVLYTPRNSNNTIRQLIDDMGPHLVDRAEACGIEESAYKRNGEEDKRKSRKIISRLAAPKEPCVICGAMVTKGEKGTCEICTGEYCTWCGNSVDGHCICDRCMLEDPS